jgi:crotonobetainyl-CoA:carnitine CoA-transferase CaiB-like acyl-CoA transferase
MDLLEPQAVPCAPILDIAGVFAHPQVLARGLRVDLPADDAAMPLVRNPMRIDGQPVVADQPPPALDQQGDAIRAALASGSGWPAR